jgi:chromosome partitioning protein
VSIRTVVARRLEPCDSPAVIIALVSVKGGCGKSTISAMLAAQAASEGLRVLAVDGDPQATLRTWAAVGAEGGHPTPTVVAMDQTMARPAQLPRLAGQFDLVLIDTPGRLDATQRAALMVADLALVPCGWSGADTWTLVEVARLIGEARDIRGDGLAAAVVLNRLKPGAVMSREARAAVAESGIPVCDATVADRVAFGEALTAGQGVVTYAPSSQADHEVRRLYKEVTRASSPQGQTERQAKTRAARR